MTVRIINADVMAGLAELADESVHCVVTSPPYWGLRDYGVEGQIGFEETPQLFIDRMVDVFREVRRVLRNDGTLWLNMGDGYSGGGSGARDAERWPKQSRNDHRIEHRRKGTDCDPKRGKGAYGQPLHHARGLKPKDLIGMPWRLALALQADGWWLRQDIIWHKPNPMPESVRDRPTKAHEYLFLMAKSARYYYDQEAIREEAVYEGDKRHLRTDKSKDTGGPREDNGSRMRTGNATSGRNRRSVWEIPTQPFPGAHFATFPQKLVEPCILAGTKPSDVVLDPFAGSGTVGVVAYRHGREFLGFELNPEYCDMANPRVQAARKGITLVEENAGQEVLFP